MPKSCCSPMTETPPGADDIRIADMAKALGHPARVAIMRRLYSQGECLCGDLVQGLPLAQATVSQHLKVLKDAGLVRSETDGPRVCYCADPKALKKLKDLLDRL